MQRIPMTADGFEALQAELKTLKSEERPAVIAAISEARSHGDLSENAEYHAAKEKQGFIEGRIADLDDKLSRAQVIENKEPGDGQVRFGAFVTIADEETGENKTYRIVGNLEADLAQGMICLSWPIARALMGKRVDDLVEVKAPKGVVEYVITEVRYS